MNKRMKKIIGIFIIMFIFCILCSSKVFARNIDTNIDGIDDNLYPRNEGKNKIITTKTSYVDI